MKEDIHDAARKIAEVLDHGWDREAACAIVSMALVASRHHGVVVDSLGIGIKALTAPVGMPKPDD